MIKDIEKIFIEKGLKVTGQRLLVAQIIIESDDHPDVQVIYNRAYLKDSKISIATVYRTLKFFEENGIIKKYDFGTGRSRYEITTLDSHDHLIDIKNNKVIEFKNSEIDKLREKVVESLGFKLVDHKLELYCIPIENDENKK